MPGKVSFQTSQLIQCNAAPTTPCPPLRLPHCTPRTCNFATALLLYSPCTLLPYPVGVAVLRAFNFSLSFMKWSCKLHTHSHLCTPGCACECNLLCRGCENGASTDGIAAIRHTPYAIRHQSKPSRGAACLGCQCEAIGPHWSGPTGDWANHTIPPTLVNIPGTKLACSCLSPAKVFAQFAGFICFRFIYFRFHSQQS